MTEILQTKSQKADESPSKPNPRIKKIGGYLEDIKLYTTIYVCELVFPTSHLFRLSHHIVYRRS